MRPRVASCAAHGWLLGLRAGDHIIWKLGFFILQRSCKDRTRDSNAEEAIGRHLILFSAPHTCGFFWLHSTCDLFPSLPERQHPDNSLPGNPGSVRPLAGKPRLICTKLPAACRRRGKLSGLGIPPLSWEALSGGKETSASEPTPPRNARNAPEFLAPGDAKRLGGPLAIGHFPSHVRWELRSPATRELTPHTRRHL